MKLALRKKTFAMKKSYFQSIISLHALKLAFNKSMRASDVNKVSANCGLTNFIKTSMKNAL